MSHLLDAERREASTRRSPLIEPLKLSHGTLECHDLEQSRRFYEEFLGLESVWHGPRTLMVRKGGDWVVVCVHRGDKVRPVGVLNHWGIDVASREAVDAARELALAHKDDYGIQAVHNVQDQHGVYSFYLQDRDGNWWEIQHCPDDQQHPEVFARGDIPVDQRRV